jgi:hypothetical protein
MSSPTTFSFSARRITLSLSVFAGLLLFAYFGVVYVRVVLNHHKFFGLNRLFDLDGEANVPAVFSTFLFLFNSALLFLIHRLGRRGPSGHEGATWLFLSLLFCFLGIDEAVSIHELFIDIIHAWARPTGIFHFVWVIPYGIATLLLAAVMLPWFFRLDGHTRRWFAASAVIFVSGAIGMEMVSGRYLELVNEQRGLVYQLMVAVEETLEMAGLIVFNHGLLCVLQRFTPVRVSLELVADAQLPRRPAYSGSLAATTEDQTPSPANL